VGRVMNGVRGVPEGGDSEDAAGAEEDVVLAGTGCGNKLAPPAFGTAGSARCHYRGLPARIARAPGELRCRRGRGKGSKGGRLAGSLRYCALP
jgi:hypothetical protein